MRNQVSSESWLRPKGGGSLELETLEGPGGKGTMSSCLQPLGLEVGRGAHPGRGRRARVEV